MKKIIFYFDGTSNDPTDADDFLNDGSITNILKMHILSGGIDSEGNIYPENEARSEEYQKVSGQKSFYYSGVGTKGWWGRKIRELYTIVCKSKPPRQPDENAVLPQIRFHAAAARNGEPLT